MHPGRSITPEGRVRGRAHFDGPTGGDLGFFTHSGALAVRINTISDSLDASPIDVDDGSTVALPSGTTPEVRLNITNHVDAMNFVDT